MKPRTAFVFSKPTNTRFIDLTGKTFSRLVVVGFAYLKQRSSSRSRTSYWNVKCQCGSDVVVCGLHLTHNQVKSCGCLRREVSRARSMKHGEAEIATPEYRAWQGMLNRCRNHNRPDFHRYGGKGISVCDKWAHSYESFLEDMGRKPSSDHSLDRINPYGNYEPSNCRWATRLQQNRNTSRTVRFKFKGKLLTVGEIGELVGLSGRLIRERLTSGWPMSEATSTPPTPRHLCCAKKLSRRVPNLKTNNPP